MRLEGKLVALRPFRAEDLLAWWLARSRLDETAQPAGAPTLAELRRRVEGSGRLREGQLELAIEAGGRVVGEIQTYRPPGRTLPPGVFEVGVVVFDPAARGRGYGGEALALLTGWLFESVGAARVQAAIEAGNAAMRRVLERSGFTRGGVVRAVGRHYRVYSITKDDWLNRNAPAGSPQKEDVLPSPSGRWDPGKARRGAGWPAARTAPRRTGRAGASCRRSTRPGR